MVRNSRWRSRASVAVVACAALPALAAPAADAAFTTSKCGGSSVGGAGASFQNLAHQVWRTNQLFKSSAFCGSGGPTVDYASVGSGAGRRNIGDNTAGGVRDFNPGGSSNIPPGSRFGASDSAVSTTQRTNIEEGRPATDDDDAKVHALPAAVGAITIVVNFPDTCQVPSSATGVYHDGDADPANDPDRTARFKVPNDRLEKFFEGDPNFDEWGELLGADSNITSRDTVAKSDQACADQAVKRVVRSDSSGTTQSFKRWLQGVQGKGPVNWDALQSTDTTWPADAGGTATVRGAQNEGVASQTIATDGSIGYVELAQARSSDFNKAADTGATNSFARDDKFWIPVQNGSGAYVEPASDPLSYKSNNNTPGANCSAVTFADRNTGNLPTDPTGQNMETYGDWTLVLGVHSNTGYGVCSLTFILPFDDNSRAYNAANDPKFSDQAAEEQRARTVKDYLEAIVSDQGQTVIENRDYAGLPAPVLTIARKAVASIDWNKAGNTTGGGNTGGGNTGGGGGTGSGTPTPTDPIAPGIPSNAFTIPSSRSASSGVITIRLNLPGGGQVKSQGTTTLLKRYTNKKNKRVTYGRAVIQASGAGPATLTIKPSSAIKKALKKGAKLKVSVRLTFTPNGGTANSQTKTVTVKGKKARSRR